MIIKYLLQCLELIQRVTLSYGQLFTIMSAVMAHGVVAVKETIKALETEKYKPAMVHFQKGILLLYAALAEFKAGYNVADKLAKESPDDFKALLAFANEISTDFPGMAEACFKVPEEMMLKMKEGFGKDTSRIPEFIRTSGEYMDFINVDKREVSEEMFKAAIVATYGNSPLSMLRVLKETKAHVLEKGWASLNVKGHSDIIMWADEFNMDLPANITSALNCSPVWPYEENAEVEKECAKPAVWPAIPDDRQLTGYVQDGKVLTTPKLNSGEDVMCFQPEEK